MLPIFTQDHYERYFPSLLNMNDIVKKADKFEPVKEYDPNYNHRVTRLSEQSIIRIFGTEDKTELQGKMQPVSDSLMNDINNNITLMKRLYIGIGECLYMMDRFNLFSLQGGADTLSDLYHIYEKRTGQSPFGISYSQASKFRQIFWTGLRLQITGGDDVTEEEREIFQSFTTFKNKDKIFHSASLMTRNNYPDWFKFSSNPKVSVSDVQEVARGGREILKRNPKTPRDRLTPDYIKKKMDEDEIQVPKRLYIGNINDPKETVDTIVKATDRDTVQAIRDGLTSWLNKN